MKHRNAIPIEGHVSPGFEAVRAAFAENFCRRRELGGACCVFATGGRGLKLRTETLRALAAPAIPPSRGFYDECMMGDGVRFSLASMKRCPVWPFGNEGSFGSPGTDGSLGFADPEAGIGYAYVTSRMGTSVTGDPRDLALRQALYSIIPDQAVARQGRAADGPARQRLPTAASLRESPCC
jgi:hypothetical protein